MDFRLERRRPDGISEFRELSIGVEYAVVGGRLPADDPAQAWEFTEVNVGADPPRIVAQLVDISH